MVSWEGRENGKDTNVNRNSGKVFRDILNQDIERDPTKVKVLTFISATTAKLKHSNTTNDVVRNLIDAGVRGNEGHLAGVSNKSKKDVGSVKWRKYRRMVHQISKRTSI